MPIFWYLIDFVFSKNNYCENKTTEFSQLLFEGGWVGNF